MERQPIKLENVQVFAWKAPVEWAPSQESNIKEQWIQWRTKDFEKEEDLSLALKSMKCVKENDLIWIITNKSIYLSRVSANDKRLYDDFTSFCYTTWIPMVTVYDFVKTGYWDELPGFVQWQTDHPMATFKRIDDIEKITPTIYNKLTGLDVYETTTLSRKDWFTKMLSPYQDIEDIVGLYLQQEKDYLIFIETYRQWYLCGEGCSMIKKDGSHKCYLHVIIDENFRNLLNEDDYVRLTENGKNYVYIFSVDPKYITAHDNANIINLDADAILKFTETHEYLLPERMKEWLQYVKVS